MERKTPAEVRARPARPGSVTPAALTAAKRMHAFMVRGYDELDRLIGTKLPRTYLRNSLIRLVVIEWGEGRVRQLSFYREQLAPIAGAFAVREEVYTLAARGLLVLQKSDTDGRSTCVRPTQRVVDWYCEVAHPLIAEFVQGSPQQSEEIG